MYTMRACVRKGWTRLCLLMVAGTMGMSILSVAGEPGDVSSSAFDLNAKGFECYNQGKWSEAIDWFEKAYDLAPDNPTVRRNLCNAHQSMANMLARRTEFDPAIKHLELAIGIDPRNESPLIQLGAYYLYLGRIREAIAHLEDAIDIAPPNVDAHELLGNAYDKDNDLKSACEQWKWVCEVQPTRPGIRKKLERALRQESVEAKFRPLESRHFKLTSSPDIARDEITRVVTILEHAYNTIGRQFGNVYPSTQVCVTVYKASQFSKATQADKNVGALYDGKIRIPLLDDKGNVLPDDDLRTRLFHEYTHVLVHYICGRDIAWWINEGLAESLSHEVSPAEITLLARAKASGELLSFAALSENQMDKLPAARLHTAYAQSHFAVDYLIKRYTQSRMNRVLAEIAKGAASADAFLSVFGRTEVSLLKEISRVLPDEGEPPSRVAQGNEFSGRTPAEVAPPAVTKPDSTTSPIASPGNSGPQ